MTVDFYGKEIDQYEKEHGIPYIGYISPEGELIDYNDDLGISHSTLDNIIPWTFFLWIKKINISERFNNINEINFPDKKNILLLQKDLLEFLEIIKNNPDFLNRIKSKIKESDIISSNSNNIEDILGHNTTKSLLILLKDICIEYLGYDAIEQVKPNGDLLTINKYSTIFDKPRIITTTSNSVHERFYNYLLMNWKLQQLPRYIFNKETNRFEREMPSIYKTESDEIYAQEIESIRRLVPLKDRPKYFR